MKWSYILFLPAAISVFWAFAVLFFKRRLTIAQTFLSQMLVLLGIAIACMAVYFRGHSGVLFVYDYLFECFSMFSIGMFYVGICALTEPTGVTVRQRSMMLPPLLFVVGLTVGAFILGWRRYDSLCRNIANGETGYVDGDVAYNFMLFWDHWLFPAMLLVFGSVLLIVASRKAWLYQKRFNSYYADNMRVSRIDSRIIVVLAWLFVPLGALTLWAVDFRPHLYKYWLIVLAVLLSALQWFFGRFVFKLDHDASYLSDYIRRKNGMEQL